MTLLELCEPVFQYVCRLNRIARAEGAVRYATVRAEVNELLERIANRAASDPRLKAQFEKIRLPLLFFIDSMIVESGASCSGEWDQKRLAYDHNELAGDEAFFDHLEIAQNDTEEAASERLAFYYTCLGLGFTGVYFGQPELLRQKMRDLLPRVRKYIDADHHARLCQEAYERLNTANLCEPPAPKLVGFGILFAGLALVVFFSMLLLFHFASRDLSEAVQTIRTQDAPLVD
ncbi:MAG: hypothetical protein EA425_04980 [Puniceicoccaceae bacterium]|nr:MAG: hypothetical protein EA425_04980 [Puniceicoccaceae bacterium]